MGASTTGRASRRRLRLSAAICAVSAVAFATVAGGVVVPAASADDASLTFVFAPENSGVSRPGEDLTISGTVTNLSDSAVAASVIDIGVARDVANGDELSSAFSDPSQTPTVPVGSIEVPQLPVAGSAQLSVTLPAATLDAAVAPGWGAHPVVATLRDDPATAQSVSALVRLDGDAPATLQTVVILPITTPPSIDGLIPAETLADYTAPAGDLTRKLDAATDPRITLALDPRILASIRVLGVSAPPAAVQWLERLEAMPNQIFPLVYGDADLSLEQTAGAPSPLAPTSFAAALDPANFPAQATTPTSTPSLTEPPADAPTENPSATPSASPTEAPDDGAAALPTTDELLRFEYTATDIAWPASGLVDAGDFDFAEQAGLDRAIVSGNQLQGADDSAVAAVDGHTVLVADPSSALVSEAVNATGAADARLKASRAAAVLATSAADAAGRGSVPVILPLSRSASPSLGTADVLRSVTSLPWLSLEPLETVAAAAPLAATFTPAADDRGNAAASLLADEASISSFSSVLAQPELLTGTARLDLLSTMGAGWADDRAGWDGAVEGLHGRTRDILNSISIDPSSQITVASFTAPTPVSVTNALPYPVNIVVTPKASNGRLVISGGSATIEPNSTQRVLMEARAVGNGRVSVEVRMSSPTGVQIGTPRFVQLDVQPYWETAGIAVMGALVLFLLVFGTYRSIRRRRRGTTGDEEPAAGEAAQ